MSKSILLLKIVLTCLIPITGLAAPPEQGSHTYGPVKTGDQLWEIAIQVRPDSSVTRHQVMIALLKANPQAFRVPCNINSLKIGQTLIIPTLSDIQMLSATVADTEYHRQNQEWKMFRQQRQKITCTTSTLEKSVETDSTEPILSTIQTAFSTTISEQVPTSSSSVRNEVPPVVKEKGGPAILPTLSKDSKESEAVINLQTPWIIITALTIAIFLILSLSFRRFSHRRTAKVSQTKDHRYDLNDDEKKPWRFGTEGVKLTATESGMSSPVPEESGLAAGLPREDGTTEKSGEVKDKLAYIRTYLAEGEEKAVQRLLKEVIEKGTSEQQEEAQQLIEISRKMSTLELQIGKNSPSSNFQSPPSSESTALQEVMQVGKQTPLQQYLPENEAKVFDLIDKIFEFLDHELNAQGKLVESYMNRHRPQFLETADYTVLRKPAEKVVVHEVENLSEHSPPRSRQTPRYL